MNESGHALSFSLVEARGKRAEAAAKRANDPASELVHPTPPVPIIRMRPGHFHPTPTMATIAPMGVTGDRYVLGEHMADIDGFIQGLKRRNLRNNDK